VALNGILPRDISVRSAQEVDNSFHARFSASQRTYLYLIWTAPERSALWGRFALHEPRDLDLPAMREAACVLVGVRDFASFANAGGEPGSTTVRDLRRLDIQVVMAAEDLAAIAKTADRTENPCPTAPAHGLCLLRVDY